MPRRGGDHHDAGQRPHGNGPQRLDPTPGRDQQRTPRQCQQAPVALCPDEPGQTEAHRGTSRGQLQIEAEREEEADDAHHRGGGGVGERGGDQPMAPAALGQWMPVPEDSHQPSRRGHRADRHQGHGDAPAVGVTEESYDQEGREKADKRCAEGKEGARVPRRDGPDQPPTDQATGAQRGGAGPPVPLVEQDVGHDARRHHCHPEGIEWVEGPFPVDSRGGHSDHDRSQCGHGGGGDRPTRRSNRVTPRRAAIVDHSEATKLSLHGRRLSRIHEQDRAGRRACAMGFSERKHPTMRRCTQGARCLVLTGIARVTSIGHEREGRHEAVLSQGQRESGTDIASRRPARTIAPRFSCSSPRRPVTSASSSSGKVRHRVATPSV